MFQALFEDGDSRDYILYFTFCIPALYFLHTVKPHKVQHDRCEVLRCGAVKVGE